MHMTHDMNRGLYIGLSNFKFRHTTDDFSGFIGRTKICERLKDLLLGTNCNKDSGAYLITGNRGVGKTTFVNKIKSEIENTGSWDWFMPPLFVLIGVLFFNLVHKIPDVLPFVSSICKTLFFCLLFTTFISAIRLTYKSLYRKAGWYRCLKEFLAVSVFMKHIKSKGRLFYILHLSALASFFTWFSILAYSWWGINYMHIYIALLYVGVYAFYAACVSYIANCSKRESLNILKMPLNDIILLIKCIVVGFFENLYSKLKTYIYKFAVEPKRIFIKINLGHDNLKVIDVLRLISHYIYVEYRNYLYSGKRYIFRLFLILFVAFVITKVVTITGAMACILNYSNSCFSCPDIDCVVDFYNYVYVLVIEYVSYLFNSAIDLSVAINNNIFSPDIEDWIHRPDECFFTFYEFVLFLSIVLIYKLFTYIPYLRLIPTPFSYLKELHDLVTSISSSIKREEGVEVRVPLRNRSISLNKKIEKNYPMSDARDIEKRLIDIVDKISRTKFHRIGFVLIFDELDKLESSFSEKQEDFIKSDTFSPDSIRKRREAVYTLLSGLKYLLTTMKSKFIFVAGRELYEAFRADASDRSHYLSSIFNDVIVVPSFMTDTADDRKHDIFSLTEQYVCSCLIPEMYATGELYLDNYRRYLEKTLDSNLENRELVIQKTVIELYNFIVYLTYASKGAPKKMVNLFERHIINRRQMEQKYNADKLGRSIKVETVNGDFFLSFDYYDMYMFALMSRIVLPVVYRFDRGQKHKYGDKLLVTSMFFLDHLYKFHRNSFSWRALEASPEIIDVNKVPELREHINDMLHYISQNDLKNISSGLYDFRFYKKIALEVSFLTRVSEIASAFFNFTLDETYSVKKYYQRKLEKIRKEYVSDNIPATNTIEELASIHLTLGELYLYEEEVADAIVEFDMAVSILYTIKPQEMTSEHIVLLMKAMLSIGVAYEKQNQNDRALLVYVECVKFLIASKNTDINNFGLITKESSSGKMIVKSLCSLDNDEPQLYFNKIKVENENTLVEAVDSIENLHPAIHNFLSKIAPFDTLRLLYLPILAKLQILEKVQTGGLQLTDLKRGIKEFRYLSNMMNKENLNIIVSNFFLKVGDILYYKNSQFIKNEVLFNELYADYFFEKKDSDVDASHLVCKQQTRDAYYFYLFALRVLLYGKDRGECTLKGIIASLKKWRENGYGNWDEGKFHLLAIVLTNLGDEILAEIDSAEIYCDGLLSFLFNFVEHRETKKDSIIEVLSEMFYDSPVSIYESNRLIKVVSYYLLAYMCFKKGTSNSMASFQCYRILMLLKYNMPKLDTLTKRSMLEKVARYFTGHSIQEKRTSFKEAHFEDITNWMRIFDADELVTYNSMELLDCRNLLYDESQEAILMYLGIKLNAVNTRQMVAEFQKIFGKIRYDNFSSVLNRIKWLKFMSEVNIKEVQLIVDIADNLPFLDVCKRIQKQIDNLDKAFDYKNKRDKICALLYDTIEKLYEAISLIKLYGENYALTNYYVADIYHRMMCVLEWKRILLHKWPFLKDTYGRIDGVYSADVFELISWTNVSRYYYKAKEMHEEGRTYKDMINRSCFLNDEFSDQRLHFITAHERRMVSDNDFCDYLKHINANIFDDCSLFDGFV